MTSKELLAFAAGAGVAGLLCYLTNRESEFFVDQTATGGTNRLSLISAGRRSGQRAAGHFVGVDLGGTTATVAIVSRTGSILVRSTTYLPTDDKSFDTITKLIIDKISEAIEKSGVSKQDVAAIGIGAPGNLDCEKGILVNAANFGWENVPLAPTIAKGTGLRTFLENDGNTAVLAEWWVGAGAGEDMKHIVMFTLGTGIGGGIVSNDTLIRGSTGMAGEFGHTIAEPCIGDDCTETISRVHSSSPPVKKLTGPRAGRLCSGTNVRGVLEQYASARAVGVRAKEALQDPKVASSLSTIHQPTCKDVFAHAHAGDKLAQRLVDETADYIAVGLINASRAVDPQMIVLSGGMSENANLMEPLTRHFQRRWWTINPISTCKIAKATTGNDAGVLGAACAAMLSLK